MKSPVRLLAIALLAMLPLAPAVNAQLAGKGTIQGIVSDPTGAVIPNADITITNIATHVVNHQKSTGSGFYSVAGFDPGTYDITVSAPGFQTFTQAHAVLDALQTLGVNAKLSIGSSETVTVSDELPAVNTTNATLGSTMETETFRSLPLNMGGAPRDPTSFLVFTPGVKSDGRYGSFNGGQIDHNESYVDGVAITSINVQGDNSTISRGFSVDAVDQFQAQTNGISAAYDGQGVQNYTHKSGTDTFHGSAFEYFRNTALDAWGFYSKRPNTALISATNPLGSPKKPVEHQNEFGGTLGGFVVKDKVFFFGSYDGMHFIQGANPGLVTIPTLEERNGDFSALLALKNSSGAAAPVAIYDPNSQAACTANNSTGTACRYQFGYGPGPTKGANGNPILIGAANVIPTAQISPVARYLQQFLPVLPAGSPLTNNFSAGFATGFNYQKISTKFDFDLIRKHRISFLYTYGNRKANPLCCDNSGLPQPYTPGVGNTQFYHLGLIEDNFAISDHVVNQLKYAVNFTGGPSTNPSEGDPKWAATAAGIKGLPPGQASNAFPRTAFSGANAPTQWGGTQANGYNNTGYYILDNLQLVRGRNSITAGGQFQWLSESDTPITTGTYYSQTFAQAETAGLTSAGVVNSANGYSYASFLTGAGDNANVTDNRAATVLGARFYNFAPFVQDDIRVNSKLTVNAGLRWVLNSPYREAHDRQSFFDPTTPNPIALGAMGVLKYTGYGPGTCNCRTSFSSWYKNFAPRLGLAYAIDPKTVLRASYGINYTRAGGVGGRGGAQTGTGQLGITGGGSFTSPNGGITPAFFLDQGIGATAAPSAVPQFGTGYTTTAGYTGNPNGVTYADPYLSRRAPYFNNYSLGFQREIIKQTTLSIDYSGSTGHFLGTGIGRGIYSNQLDPKYLALGPLLSKNPGASAGGGLTVLQAAQAIIPGVTPGFSNYNSTVSLAQLLRPFPEYAGVSDIFGDVGNSNYNSLQVSLAQQQPRAGLTYSIAYTFSKSLSDVNGTTSAYGNNSLRGYGIDLNDTPHNVQAFVVYNDPFGKSGGHFLTNQLIKGWTTSAVFHYTTGTPLAIGTTGCNAVFTGSCLPNLNYGVPVRINGNFHPSSYLDTTSYISSAAFSTPAAYTFGNAPNAAAFGLRNPNSYDVDASLRRQFQIYERLRFTLQGDVFNIDNHTQFGGLNLTPTNASFGTVSSQSNRARDFQLAARFDF